MAHLAKLGAQTDEFVFAFTGWPTTVSFQPQTLPVALLSLVPGRDRSSIDQKQILIIYLEQDFKVQRQERRGPQNLSLRPVPTSQPIRC